MTEANVKRHILKKLPQRANLPDEVSCEALTVEHRPKEKPHVDITVDGQEVTLVD